ncbi:hypothetical protein ABF83_16070 [Enterobacter asburiae]|nr:hypothetical protein ABF83_16070 [Enterobacter asburiae]
MLRQERSARPKRVFPVELPNRQSAGHLRLRTRKTAWLVTQGRVTTIFAADTPAFRASKAAWRALLQIVGGDKLIIPFC